MSNLVPVMIIATAILSFWYGYKLINLLREKSFDPTQITYYTPLNLYNYWPGNLIMALAVLANILNAGLLSLILCAILLFLGLAQIFLLSVFGRAATQPHLYYVLLAINAGQLMVFGGNLSLAVAVFLIICQVSFIQWWRAHKSARYNNWVARKVRRINRHYSAAAEGLSKRDWFFVLHFAVTESIARPALSRLGERLYFYIKRPEHISSGIMQVKADKLLSNAESMRRGSIIVSKALRDMPANLTEPIDQLKWLAKVYNGSLDERANADYTGYLTSTYPGLLLAWKEIESDT